MKHVWTICLLCILVGLMIRVEEVKAEAMPEDMKQCNKLSDELAKTFAKNGTLKTGNAAIDTWAEVTARYIASGKQTRAEGDNDIRVFVYGWCLGGFDVAREAEQKAKPSRPSVRTM